MSLSKKLSILSALASVFVLLTVCLGLVFSSTPIWAQAPSTGTIIGQVIDSSGAVVPNATITITDKATTRKRTTKTNETGAYAFVNIFPGTYDIVVNQPGFAEARVLSQVVEVGKQLTINVALKVGGASEVVEVQATGAELQTLNATIGNTVTGIALEALPSLGRDVSTFLTLQPGVSPDGSVAGAVVDQSTFMLDGGNNSSDMDGSMTVYTPSFAGDPTGGVITKNTDNIGVFVYTPTGVMPTPQDSVEEFKVGTTNQTADFNNSAGMQVSVVTKRGTNAWHGTVYEYYLDNNFSANTWENKQSGTPVPDFHYNRFGGAIGGPIIPKEILGGKTYFFANYQGFRWPNSETFARAVPSAGMRNGFLTFGGTRYNLKTLDPRGIGISPTVQQLWNLMPMPNATCATTGLFGSKCDDLNEGAFKGNLSIPQNDNFGVVRLDHAFSPKWNFMGSYRYYRLERATHNQVDISKGVATSLANRPQEPWYLVLGLTTTISPHVTNDFRYSFLRNWWARQSMGGPAQLAGLGAALEPFGESRTTALVPYNVDTQNVRTRFWDGKDHFFSDNVSMLKGNHLLQFGGQYQHNFNYHQRTDNGGGINYYPTYQLGDSNGAGLVDMSAIPAPAGVSSKTWNRDVAAVLGIVTDTQIAYTRSGANLALNPKLTPAFDKSRIPYYNVYFSDTWHMRPSFTLTYGLGWTLEMPPVEENGKQVEFVDANDQPIDIKAYMTQRKAAALKGEVFNPEVGFALVGNTANGLKYPYNPFYGGFSPRVAAAWNPDLGERWGGKNTVFRGGYGRIYGRLNGVDLVLVPLLGTGLIQAVTCQRPLAGATLNMGTCGPATPSVGAMTDFRIGIAAGLNGLTAPIPAASATLPQPLFPGFNDVSAGAGEALDPHFRPNSVDSFDFTIQHQISSKVSVEVGAISRWIHNEYQPINVNAVPYMMTLGGQQFASAYAAVEKVLGCATSNAACGAAVPSPFLADKKTPNPAYTTYFNSTFAQEQAFFKAALTPSYCTASYAGIPFANCTAAIAAQQFGQFQNQQVWDLWSALDNGGTAPGWNFPTSMLNSPILGSAFGAGGQISGGVGVNASLGHGNYNAGFVSLKMNSWHGLTMQQNFTWSKTLGTGAQVQATSEYTVNDPFNLDNMYGVQSYDRKFVYNAFFVYQVPFFRGQQGFLGHALGGWTFAPMFAAGSGAPIACQTNTGDFGDLAPAGAGAQEFGAGNANFFGTQANCLFSKRPPNVSAHFLSDGSVNLFADPAAVYATARPPILGLDNKVGGFGQLHGLPYWNLDLSIKKNFKLTERFNADAQVVFTNVLNHNVLLDPFLDLTSPGTWGALTAQGNNPRTMEFGFRVSF